MPINYENPAIPTKYRNVAMRSRLEACWARFFDCMEWPWAYEPADLKSYIPDFVLKFDRPVLVECKPCYSLTELNEAPEVREKIDRSGWGRESLIVGAGLMPERGTVLTLDRLGLMRTKSGWGPAKIFKCSTCNGFSPVPEHDDNGCRRCGQGVANIQVSALCWWGWWTMAQNANQWKGPPSWKQIEVRAVKEVTLFD